MSLPPASLFHVPERTADIARAAFPKGNRYMQMRDTLGTVYTHTAFADLYPALGQPAEAPWRLALVTLMQFAENLTDRQAADAVRGRMDWKYALGLDLTDAGVDFSVLSECRTRLLTGEAVERLLTQMLRLFVERGLLHARGTQRTDSTQIVAAVRDLNRLELVGETLHHALHSLAREAPTWVRAQVTADWCLRYGQRFSDYRLPKGRQDRQQLAETIGQDGMHLLTQMYDAAAPAALRALPAVETLRQVWGQQYDQEGGVVRWREAKDCPPASLLIASPYDLESRYSEKRGHHWRGYKVHLTETCDDEAPSLITHVETTSAPEQDVAVVETMHHQLADQAMLPAVHIVDGAYVSSDGLVDSQQDSQVTLLGPMRQDPSWQAHDPQAFDMSQFVIDWDQEVVTCPNGKQSRSWKPTPDSRGKPIIQVSFHKKDCTGCVVRSQCTRSTAGPRELTLHPKAQQRALQAARERQQTETFKARYKRRAGIEGTMSQAAYALGMRRTRYRGIKKTHLHHIAIATAINLQRSIDWLWEVPRAKTSTSHFARLALAA
jgi:transposase